MTTMRDYINLLESILMELTSTEAKSIFKSNGVSVDGMTQDQLKLKYRELVKKFHPDLGGDVEKMKMVNAAYDVLKKDDLGKPINSTPKSSSATDARDERGWRPFFPDPKGNPSKDDLYKHHKKCYDYHKSFYDNIIKKRPSDKDALQYYGSNMEYHKEKMGDAPNNSRNDSNRPTAEVKVGSWFGEFFDDYVSSLKKFGIIASYKRDEEGSGIFKFTMSALPDQVYIKANDYHDFDSIRDDVRRLGIKTVYKEIPRNDPRYSQIMKGKLASKGSGEYVAVFTPKWVLNRPEN